MYAIILSNKKKESKHYPSPPRKNPKSPTRSENTQTTFSKVFDFLWSKTGRRKQKWGIWGISGSFAFIVSLYKYDILKVFVKVCFLYVISSPDFLIYQKILWIGQLFLHDWNFQQDCCIVAILSWYITMFLSICSLQHNFKQVSAETLVKWRWCLVLSCVRNHFFFFRLLSAV